VYISYMIKIKKNTKNETQTLVLTSVQKVICSQKY